MYSKILQLRPTKIKTISLLRPVFASPKWYFPYDIIFDIKTTSLIRPLLGSPKGGLNRGILLYVERLESNTKGPSCCVVYRKMTAHYDLVRTAQKITWKEHENKQHQYFKLEILTNNHRQEFPIRQCLAC